MSTSRCNGVWLLACLAFLPSCGGHRGLTSSAPAIRATPHAPSRLYAGGWQKGMSIPAWWYDAYTYASTLTQLDAIAALHCDYVAITPTWYMQTYRSTTIAPEVNGRSATDESVIYVIQQAHQRGLKVLLKPHVDQQDGTWRGNIKPSSPDKWFQSYRDFILHYAQLAAQTGAEELCVGTEFSSMSGPTYTGNWRSIVADVRAAFSGPLTYAANWGWAPSGEPFVLQWWDALDYIAIDGYYPVSDAHNPTVAQAKAGWLSFTDPSGVVHHTVDDIAGLCSRTGKRVIFTEIGYNSIATAGDPWYIPQSTTPDMEAQQNCVQAALEVWDQYPCMAGMFWWVWDVYGNGGTSDTSMRLNGKPAATALGNWYAGSGLGDTTAPAAPAGLQAQASGSAQINLQWSASSDNVAITGYKVYRNDGATFPSAVASYSDMGLNPSTAYSYQVTALDAAGNESAKSSPASATTGASSDTEPPTPPDGLAVVPGSVTVTQIGLQWNAATDNTAVTGYRLYRNNVLAASVAGTSYTDTHLAPSTQYTYQVSALDAAGNESQRSTALLAATLADTNPPTAPGSPAATALNASQIQVQWGASSDDVGVAGYQVQRSDGATFSAATSPYTDGGLSPSTTYGYQVRALDAAGNASQWAGPVYATTLSAGFDFETGTQGWTAGGKCRGVSSVTTVAYSGSRSLAMQLKSITAKSAGWASGQPDGTLAGGRTVTMHVYLGAAATNVRARAYVQDASGTETDGPVVSLPSRSWATLTVTVPAGARTPLSRVGVWVATSTGTFTGTLSLDAVAW